MNVYDIFMNLFFSRIQNRIHKCVNKFLKFELYFIFRNFFLYHPHEFGLYAYFKKYYSNTQNIILMNCGTLPIRYLGMPMTTKSLTSHDYKPLITKFEEECYAGPTNLCPLQEEFSLSSESSLAQLIFGAQLPFCQQSVLTLLRVCAVHSSDQILLLKIIRRKLDGRIYVIRKMKKV